MQGATFAVVRVENHDLRARDQCCSSPCRDGYQAIPRDAPRGFTTGLLQQLFILAAACR